MKVYSLQAVLLLALLAGLAQAETLQERIDILWQRAERQADQGKLDDALDSANKAVQTAPDSPDAWWLLGWTRALREEYPQAEEAYKHALSLASGSAELHNNLGWVYYAQGKLDDAIGSYTEALRIDPDFSLAYVNVGLALTDKSELVDAAEVLQRAIDGADTSARKAQACNALAYCRAHQGDLKEALRLARLAISLDGGNAVYHDTLGVMALLSDQVKQSEGPLRKAISLGDLPASHAALAYALAKIGDSKGSRAELAAIAKALQASLASRNLDMCFWAGKAYRELEMAQEAQRVFAMALASWPTHPWAAQMKQSD